MLRHWNPSGYDCPSLVDRAMLLRMKFIVVGTLDLRFHHGKQWIGARTYSSISRGEVFLPLKENMLHDEST